MAPKEPFKVHSLSKHIEDTKKGITADAQFNKRPAGSKLAINIKKQPQAVKHSILTSQSDSSSDSSSSDSDSDSDSGNDPATFMKKLTKPSKPAASAKSAAPRTQKDEIDDSDVERQRAVAEKQKAKVPVAKRKKPEPESESESESSSSDSDEGEEQVKKTNGAASKSKSTTTSATSSSGASSSSEDDSGSESDSEESEDESEPAKKPVAKAKELAKTPAPVKSAPVKPTTIVKPVAKSAAKVVDSDSSSSGESESGSESDSESEEEPAKPVKPAPAVNAAVKGKTAPVVNGKPSKAKVAVAASSSSSDEDDESSGSDASESGSASSESDGEESDEESSPQKKVTQRVEPKKANTGFQSQDFSLRKADNRSIEQEIKKICSTANLQGKQLWYFTMPSDIPISVVENMEVPLHQTNSDKTLISHAGQDYNMAVDSVVHKGSIQILIPSADGTKYQNGEYSGTALSV